MKIKAIILVLMLSSVPHVFNGQNLPRLRGAM